MAIGLVFTFCQALFAVDDPTILWYKFDDDFKNEIEDASPFGHNGTVTGNVEFDEDGQIGGAVRFAGGSIKVQITDELNPAENLTIEFWIRPDKVPAATYWRLLHKGWVSAGSYICGIDNNWMVMAYTWDVNNTNNVRTDANMANAVQNETWSYYAATYDGKIIVLYIDGKELVRTPSNGKINGAFEIVIAEGFLGMMDEIRFSNVALGPDDIAKHMAGETGKAVDAKNKLATTWSAVKSDI